MAGVFDMVPAEPWFPRIGTPLPQNPLDGHLKAADIIGKPLFLPFGPMAGIMVCLQCGSLVVEEGQQRHYDEHVTTMLRF